MNANLTSLQRPHDDDSTRVHIVHFVAGPEAVVVVTDDCGFEGETVMSPERADRERSAYLDAGFTPFECSYAERLLAR